MCYFDMFQQEEAEKALQSVCSLLPGNYSSEVGVRNHCMELTIAFFHTSFHPFAISK